MDQTHLSNTCCGRLCLSMCSSSGCIPCVCASLHLSSVCGLFCVSHWSTGHCGRSACRWDELGHIVLLLVRHTWPHYYLCATLDHIVRWLFATLGPIVNRKPLCAFADNGAQSGYNNVHRTQMQLTMALSLNKGILLCAPITYPPQIIWEACLLFL